MADETDSGGKDTGGKDLDGDPKTPPVGRVDRIFLRLSVLNTVLAVAGVFTGAVALYAALTESAAVKRQSAATVWPYVQFSTSDQLIEGDSFLQLHFTNVGVGPAVVRDMRIRLDGQVVTDWRTAIAEIAPEQSPPFATEYVRGRVMSPGERVDMFATTDDLLVREILTRISSAESSIEYCYCSIFEECWAVDSRVEESRPQRVKACPDYGDEAFGN